VPGASIPENGHQAEASERTATNGTSVIVYGNGRGRNATIGLTADGTWAPQTMDDATFET
jgi:hypothetical protein